MLCLLFLQNEVYGLNSNQFVFLQCYQSVTNWLGSSGSPGSLRADSIIPVTLICLLQPFTANITYKCQVNVSTEEFLQLIPFNSFTKVWGKLNEVWLNPAVSSGILPQEFFFPAEATRGRIKTGRSTLIVFFRAHERYTVKHFKLVQVWDASSLTAFKHKGRLNLKVT